jgi:hypothetical protein
MKMLDERVALPLFRLSLIANPFQMGKVECQKTEVEKLDYYTSAK